MATHKFLNQKSWHVTNKANQRKVWMAEEKAKHDKSVAQERLREWQREVDFAKNKATLGMSASDAQKLKEKLPVSFMYQPPPGFKLTKDGTDGEEKKAIGSNTSSKAQDQNSSSSALSRDAPGGGGGGGGGGGTGAIPVQSVNSNANHHAESKNSSESYDDDGGEVHGPKQREQFQPNSKEFKKPMTKKELEEKFPFLKNAPVQGNYTDDLNVHIRPFGVELRKVRCVRCGKWGHQSGDRECTMRDQNPNDAARQRLEDPLTLIQEREQTLKQKYQLKRGNISPIRGGLSANAENQQMIPNDDDEPNIEPEEAERQAEREWLASLTKKQKKRLLKRVLKEEKKKRKKQQQQKDSSSSDDSSASGTDDSEGAGNSDGDRRGGGREKRKRKKDKKEKVKGHSSGSRSRGKKQRHGSSGSGSE